MKNGRYLPTEEGKWVRWDRKDNLEQCCDCLLVHRVDYRIVKRGSHRIIEFRCWRDERATARARKRHKVKLSPVS